MPTARNRAASDDEGGGTNTQTSGFSEEQRTELADLIAQAIGSAKPPKAEPPSGPPPKSDSEWDEMSDRRKESHVREMVVSIIDDLRAKDEADRLRSDVDQLNDQMNKAVEPEAAPSVVTRIQRLLWGDEK